MDPCERKYIYQNLPELIENTLCREMFLTKLQQRGVLDISDIQHITESGIRHAQAQKLYETLMMREQAFDALLSSLKETSQTGAFGILNEFYKSTTFTANGGRITYDKDKVLGSGSYFTKVYQGKFGGREVAVKVINSEFIPKDVALKEVALLLKCDWHENIVRYFNAQISAELILIALEICDTTLASWVGAHTAAEACQPQLEVDILRQATSGVGHLHSLKIVHRDIKPDNILLVELKQSSWVRVKITDFGLSRRLPKDKSSFTFHESYGVGTIDWASPEMLQHYSNENTSQGEAVRMTTAMDIFSLGCVFYFVISGGAHPFGNKGRRTGYILDGSPQLLVKDIKRIHFPSILLIQAMITLEPRQRPSCEAILSHPFFWNKERSLRFLNNVAACSYKKEDTIANCMVQLARHRHFVLGTLEPSSWIRFVDPNLHAVIESRVCFDPNTMCSLLQIIHHFNLNFTQLSPKVKSTLGNSPSESVAYWKLCFPFLMDMVWTSFRGAADVEDSLKNCYKHNFEFNLENVDQLVTTYLAARHKNEKVTIVENNEGRTSPTKDDETQVGVLKFHPKCPEIPSEKSEPDQSANKNKVNPGTDTTITPKSSSSTNGFSPIAENQALADQLNDRIVLGVDDWDKYCDEVESLILKDRSEVYKYHLREGMTPLKYDNFIKALVTRNLRLFLKVPDKSKCMPVHHAIQKLELLPETLVRMRQDVGADFSSVDNRGRNVLVNGILGGRSVPLLKTLMEMGDPGAKFGMKNGEMEKLVQVALECGHLDAVNYFNSKSVQVRDTVEPQSSGYLTPTKVSSILKGKNSKEQREVSSAANPQSPQKPKIPKKPLNIVSKSATKACGSSIYRAEVKVERACSSIQPHLPLPPRDCHDCANSESMGRVPEQSQSDPCSEITTPASSLDSGITTKGDVSPKPNESLPSTPATYYSTQLSNAVAKWKYWLWPRMATQSAETMPPTEGSTEEEPPTQGSTEEEPPTEGSTEEEPPTEGSTEVEPPTEGSTEEEPPTEEGSPLEHDFVELKFVEDFDLTEALSTSALTSSTAQFPNSMTRLGVKVFPDGSIKERKPLKQTECTKATGRVSSNEDGSTECAVVDCGPMFASSELSTTEHPSEDSANNRNGEATDIFEQNRIQQVSENKYLLSLSRCRPSPSSTVSPSSEERLETNTSSDEISDMEAQSNLRITENNGGGPFSSLLASQDSPKYCEPSSSSWTNSENFTETTLSNENETTTVLSNESTTGRHSRNDYSEIQSIVYNLTGAKTSKSHSFSPTPSGSSEMSLKNCRRHGESSDVTDNEPCGDGVSVSPSPTETTSSSSECEPPPCHDDGRKSTLKECVGPIACEKDSVQLPKSVVKYGVMVLPAHVLKERIQRLQKD